MKPATEQPLIQVWRVTLAVSAAAVVMLVPDLADAATAIGSSMPWESPIDKLSTSLQGPVAKAVGAASIAGSGLAVAMGETGSMLRRAGNLAVGGSVAFNAASWGLPLLGYSAAVTI